MTTQPLRKSNRYEIDMCSGPLFKKILSFSLPLVLSMNLQLLFNAVDVIVVGKFSGSNALAAVGSTTSLINLIINLWVGVSLGAGVMAGHFFATDDTDGMQKTVHTAITFAMVGGLVVSVVGILFSKWALRLMATPPEILDQSVLYIRVFLLGMPFFLLYNYGASILRGVGDTKRPLIYLIIAGIINAALNLALVILFHLGVLGVALATVVSQAVSCFLVLRCLHRTDGSYRLSFSKLAIHLPYLKKLFKIGLPAGLQSVVINFSNILLQSSVNSFGGIAMAGYTASNNIFGFLYATLNSFSQTCMNFTGQNYAVKQFKRMDRVLLECALISVSTMLILGSLVYAFGHSLLSVYTDSEAVIDAGMQIFLYTTTTYFLCSLMDLFPGAMRGMGYSTVPMLLSIIGTVGTRIFWIYLIFPHHHSLDILFVSYPLSWGITVGLQAVCYIWVRSRLQRRFADASDPSAGKNLNNHP